MNKVCFSLQEAAEMLSLSQITLYRLVSKGGFPHRRIGKRILIDKEVIKNYGKVVISE